MALLLLPSCGVCGGDAETQDQDLSVIHRVQDGLQPVRW